MVRFAGYARKREPKWPYAVIALIILIVVMLGVYIVSALSAWLESEIDKRGQPAPATVAAVTTTAPAAPMTTAPVPVVTTTAASAAAVPAGLKVDLKVVKLVVTSGVDDSNLPVDDLSQVSVNEYGTIYCYSSVRNDSSAQVIRHVWIAPGGRTAADIELTAHSGATDTYSYVSLAGMAAGEWEVRVETKDGRIIGRKSFTTY